MLSLPRRAGFARWLPAFAIACSVLAAVPPLHAQTARPEVVGSFPHDREAYTQGLLLHAGRFYESTGLVGRSTLRRVIPATGAVEWRFTLAGNLFGEGLALVNDRFIQLTWQNNVAMIYDLDFNREGTFDYQGEGWGLCYDGARLVMSDGSDRLFFRNPQTFALIGQVSVTRGGTPVSRLNELECVGKLVYANVYQTDTIVRIDPGTGQVLTTIDASGLLTTAEAVGTDVLNGIAFDAASNHFFLTGKLWPKVFEVRFDFDPHGNGGQQDAGANGASGMGGTNGTSGAVDAGNSGGTAGAANDGSPPRDSNASGGSAGFAGAGGAGGAGGSGFSGASSGAGTSAGGNAGPPRETPPTDSSAACACRLPRAPAGGALWLAPGLLFALLRARRAQGSR
jgi:glutaminyl-peptide cyclotransferase